MKVSSSHDQNTMSAKLSGISAFHGRDGTMRTMCLNQLSWRSYTTLCAMISACIGFALSIALVFIVFIVHVDFAIRFSGFYIDGHLFSIVSVFIGPFVGAAVGFLGSIITHPVFELMLAQFSGIPLKGKWLDSEEFNAREEN